MAYDIVQQLIFYLKKQDNGIMMSKDSDYGYRYYDFMRRAYRTIEDKPRLGITRGIMMELVQNEQGRAIKKQSVDKLNEKLQGYIGKALEKMLKFKVNEEERAKITMAHSQLAYSYGSDALIQVIGLAMDATHRLKENQAH